MDFEQAWGGRIRQWIGAIAAAVGGDDALANALFHVFGYEPLSREVAIDGPILAASGETMKILSAGVLYAELGLPWHEAEKIAVATIMSAFGTPLTEDEIKPLGDVKGTIRKLHEAGIAIAVATADNRDITEHCLELLEIRQDVDILMCGDDPLPQKPDSGVLAWIGAELNSDPANILMVGDTINDMLTGRNANAAGCIGISPPGGNGSTVLAPFADVVLNTIADLQVGCS
jgi:phosphoglycolate phosphatase-like HAD superfamily hydrolase